MSWLTARLAKKRLEEENEALRRERDQQRRAADAYYGCYTSAVEECVEWKQFAADYYERYRMLTQAGLHGKVLEANALLKQERTQLAKDLLAAAEKLLERYDTWPLGKFLKRKAETVLKGDAR